MLAAQQCLSAQAMWPATWVSATESPRFAAHWDPDSSCAKPGCVSWNALVHIRAQRRCFATNFWIDPLTTPWMLRLIVSPFGRALLHACRNPGSRWTVPDAGCISSPASRPNFRGPADAKDLYISDWFRKARACVESTGCPWAILSAEYGLLHPDEVIRPYEKTLNAMPVAERRSWANEVLESMDPYLRDIDTVVFFAGERYRELLQPGLRAWGVDVVVPMLGLRQGQQLAWLNDHLHG